MYKCTCTITYQNWNVAGILKTINLGELFGKNLLRKVYCIYKCKIFFLPRCLTFFNVKNQEPNLSWNMLMTSRTIVFFVFFRSTNYFFFTFSMVGILVDWGFLASFHAFRSIAMTTKQGKRIAYNKINLHIYSLFSYYFEYFNIYCTHRNFLNLRNSSQFKMISVMIIFSAGKLSSGSVSGCKNWDGV